MDSNGSYRFRHRKTLSSDRFFDINSTVPPQTSSEENELNEDDIFSAGDSVAESSSKQGSSPYSSVSSITLRRNSVESGILAALTDQGNYLPRHFYQKTAVSSSSSSSAAFVPLSKSSARLIPSIPKPPERATESSFLSKYHQSAPVNVPAFSMAKKWRKKEFDEIEEEEEDEGDREMLPPHEIVARTQSPVVACSVLEGVGRTLKGRDLRRVRNAVFRQTGFLD